MFNRRSGSKIGNWLNKNCINNMPFKCSNRGQLDIGLPNIYQSPVLIISYSKIGFWNVHPLDFPWCICSWAIWSFSWAIWSCSLSLWVSIWKMRKEYILLETDVASFGVNPILYFTQTDINSIGFWVNLNVSFKVPSLKIIFRAVWVSDSKNWQNWAEICF